MPAIENWVAQHFGTLRRIYRTNKNYGVPEEWFAGLVSVECASVNPKAKRTEPEVCAEILKVRNGGISTAYPGFNAGRLGTFIKDPHNSRDRVLMLGDSYGIGQIMGYHYLERWGVLPEQFSNLTLEQSAMYTLRYMAEAEGNARKFVQAQHSPQPWNRLYEFMLHIWNTGHAVGVPTTDPQYVAKAYAARKAYQQAMGGKA